jgi:tetratricopeptide (TPR) repeat protein
VAPDWANIRLRVLFAGVLENIADSREHAHDHPRAQTLLNEAISLRREAFATNSTAAGCECDIAGDLGMLGSIAGDQQEWANAKDFYERDIAIRRKLMHDDPNDRQDQTELVETLGQLSYYLLFLHDWAGARAAADEALTLDPTRVWIATNAAHARMFNGDTAAAREIYLQHRGMQLGAMGSWEQNVLNDYVEFRKVGMNNPLMDEVTKAFADTGAVRSTQ